jgi:hypothetical protein
MAQKVRKLTPALIRRLVKEEKEKYEKDVKAAASKTKEVEADEFADTLEKHIDYMAALKIKEANLRKQLQQIAEQRKLVRAKIAKLTG